ncbi:MAG: hypothetical protein ACI8RA_002589 [Chlamydiales bacterium]|jgi:hypothetical protein
MDPTSHSSRSKQADPPYVPGKALTDKESKVLTGYVRIDRASKAILRDAGSASSPNDTVDLRLRLSEMKSDVDKFISLSESIPMAGSIEMRRDSLEVLAKTKARVVTTLKTKRLWPSVSFSPTSTVKRSTVINQELTVPTKEDHTHDLSYNIGDPRRMESTSTGQSLSHSDEPFRDAEYDILSPSKKNSEKKLHGLAKNNIPEENFNKIIRQLGSLLHCINDGLDDSLDYFSNHPPSETKEVHDHLKGSIKQRTDKLYGGLKQRLADDPEACELFKDKLPTMVYLDQIQNERAEVLKWIVDSEVFDTYIVGDLSKDLDKIVIQLSSDEDSYDEEQKV